MGEFEGVVLGPGETAATVELSRLDGGFAETVRVNLTGVASPHGAQRRAGKAMRFLLDLAHGERVTVDVRGDAGRVRLGKVWLHEELVRAGWPWVVPGGPGGQGAGASRGGGSAGATRAVGGRRSAGAVGVPRARSAARRNAAAAPVASTASPRRAPPASRCTISA